MIPVFPHSQFSAWPDKQNWGHHIPMEFLMGIYLLLISLLLTKISHELAEILKEVNLTEGPLWLCSLVWFQCKVAGNLAWPFSSSPMLWCIRMVKSNQSVSVVRRTIAWKDTQLLFYTFRVYRNMIWFPSIFLLKILTKKDYWKF